MTARIILLALVVSNCAGWADSLCYVRYRSCIDSGADPSACDAACSRCLAR